MKFTVLGATGFIGAALCEYFRTNNIEYFAPPRDYVLNNKDELGHVIYAIGLTADFRTRKFETINAHVCKVNEFLQVCNFTSFLYLSSTRVYSGLSNDADELSSLSVNPCVDEDLYNISKLMGESLCLSAADTNIRIARLSNVIGNDFNSSNFITSLVREIRKTGKLTMHTSPQSSKDYIGIDDVVRLLPLICTSGKEKIYNVASGKNIANSEIIEFIARKLAFDVQYAPGAPEIIFPVITTKRITSEFSFEPGDIYNTMDNMISHYFKLTT